MRKLYQTEWYGISFTTFTQPDRQRLADKEFYDAFYQRFFTRYPSMTDLPPHALATLGAKARFIHSRLGHINSRVLSIGCGTGIIEKHLHENGVVNLIATEVAATPLRWISPIIGNASLHVGVFPTCLPDEQWFDYIFLSAVDYCFERADWIRVLAAARERLAPNGRCLVISASLYDSRFFNVLRLSASEWISRLTVRKKLQLWGYLRTRDNYRAAMHKAGFTNCEDGFFSDQHIYWIEGIHEAVGYSVRPPSTRSDEPLI